MLCTRRYGCSIEFTSPAYAAAQKREAEQQAAREAARPIAP